MTKVLEYATRFFFVLLVVEVVVIWVAASDDQALAKDDAGQPAKGLVLEAADVAYEASAESEVAIASEKAETVVEKVEAAPEEPEAATEEAVVDDEVGAEDEIIYYDSDEGQWLEQADDGATYDIDVAYDDDSGYFDANINGTWHSGADFRFTGGSGYEDGSGFSYTWYSENILPGGGLDIPGRHVGDEGYVCDGDGNICIASDDLPKGTVVNVPFGNGTAVVYDSGSGYGNLDVYVSW